MPWQASAEEMSLPRIAPRIAPRYARSHGFHSHYLLACIVPIRGMPLIVQQGSEEWSRRTAGLRVSPFVALVSYNHLLCEHRRRGRRFFDCIHEDSWKRNAIIRRERPRVKGIHACVAVLLGFWCCGMKCFADRLSLLCIHCTWLLAGKPYRIVFCGT